MKDPNGRFYFDQEDETRRFVDRVHGFVQLWSIDTKCVNEKQKLESLAASIVSDIDENYYLIPKDVVHSRRLFVNDGLGTLEPICSPLELIDYGSISSDLEDRYRMLRKLDSIQNKSKPVIDMKCEAYMKSKREVEG